ncbi:MAG: hypothetical protein FJ405_18565 [Verrucomicrobia bacterium]|nr:hypothetical protein [Verrucomicrobiota bacterium]
MNEWHIQSRSHTCQNCTHGFKAGSNYHTLLFDEKKEFLRLDICPKCWEEQYSHSRDKQGFISHWMGVYEPPPAAAPEAIRKDTAESLLRKLVELNDPDKLPASYILAVMLERKRILRVKEQIRQGTRRIFIYEQPKTGDVFTIPDPDLQLDQLEQVQRQVAGLLEHGIQAHPGHAAGTPAPEAPSGPESASAAQNPEEASVAAEAAPQP